MLKYQQLLTKPHQKQWHTTRQTRVVQLTSLWQSFAVISPQSRAVIFDTSAAHALNHIEQSLKHYLNTHTDRANDNSRVHLESPPVKVVAIILSHMHFDHAGNIARLAQRYNCPIIAHASLHNALLKGICTMPQGANPLTRFMLRLSQLLKINTSTVQSIDPHINDGVAFLGIDNDIERDNEDISTVIKRHPEPLIFLPALGEHTHLKILLTPGHTDASLSLIIDDEIALVGDLFVNYLPFKRHIFPPFCNDKSAVIESWHKLLIKTPETCQLFLPAHGNLLSRRSLQMHYERLQNKIVR